ncbi:MAG: hypothetical protein B7Z47_05410 [Chthoniobacter sp. 12-60-6]|nr:MAG: hypothetical protein B7Z47_05410 [Chthoniobacter sp. 12-60-6]
MRYKPQTLFRSLPINGKLTIIIMLTTAVTLIVACSAFLLYERQTLRQSMARSFAIIADTFDDNVSSGLAFDNPESITQTLNTLKADPGIMAARVYDKSGAPVAMYQRAGAAGSYEFPVVEGTGQHFRSARLDTFQDITLEGELVGTVYLAADFAAINAGLRRSMLIILVVLGCALLLAYFLSKAFRPLISAPISHLAEVAHIVATKKDYSTRARKENDDELGRLIDAFNEMLAQIQLQDTALHVARENLEKRVQERTAELAKSVSLLNATLESTADGIMAAQFNGEIVCHNSKFAAMWGVPASLLEAPHYDTLMGHAGSLTDDPEGFVARAKDSEDGPDGEAFDVVRLKDGRTFERYVKPQKIDGKRVGLVINFRDISQRRQSEFKLAEVNERLLSISRQAGMAEVATSILHNVGNVLNSVSISAEVASSKVRQTRMSGLRKVGELLKDNSADYAAFFTTNPKAKDLPDYLLLLLSHLDESQQGVLAELELLRKNIDHIKEIVAMQQSYARGCGVLEQLTMEELVEDAVHINHSSFERHHLNVVREIESMPPFLVDRHKVLQILVNLLSNAKHAMDEAGPDKRLVVSAKRQGDDRVTISITDNGIGIAGRQSRDPRRLPQDPWPAQRRGNAAQRLRAELFRNA